jgi:predicted RNA-binding protein with PIN domain
MLMTPSHHLILIDGYNVIRRSDALARAERRSLQHGRDTLIVQLAARYSRGPYHIMVIFDGAGNAETREARYGMTIIFTRDGETADSCIVRIAQEAQAQGKRVTIATDDREIRDAISHLQPDVQAQSASEMGDQLNAPPKLLAKQYKHRSAVRRIIADRDSIDNDPEVRRQARQSGNPRRSPKKR